MKKYEFVSVYIKNFLEQGQKIIDKLLMNMQKRDIVL